MSAFLIGFILIVFLALPNPALAGNTSSLNLDGSNDYVEADSMNSSMVNISAFSFGAWVRPTTAAVGKGIGGFYASNGANNNLLFWSGNTRDSKYSYIITSGFLITSTHTFPTGVWTHVFATTDASNNTILYVNGQVEGSATNTARPAANGLFTIGQDYDTGPTASDFWQGQIDDYRVYNRALTQDQIKKIMRDDYNEGLVGHWKFDDNTGCSAFDSTGQGFVGVLLPTCSSDIPTWNSTVKAPLGVAGPNINNGVESKGFGDYKFIGRTTVEDTYIIDSVSYSVNNSSEKGVGAKDGNWNSASEDFEFNFRSDDNNAGFEGFLLDVKVADSGNREAHRIHFEPFNLTSVKKLADNTLQFQFNVHKNKELMKDKLSEYQINYTGSKEGSKILLQNIPTSSDTILDNDNMKVEYQNGSANLTVTTKNKFSEPEGKYTFKIVAQSKNGNLSYESNGQILDTTSVIVATTAPKRTTSTLGVNTTQSSVTPSASPKPIASPYTPPQPKPRSLPAGPPAGRTGRQGWNLGQAFVNFHLWLFSLFPWSPVTKP